MPCTSPSADGCARLAARPDELREATKNFAPERRLDAGGAPITYRGELPGASPRGKATPVVVRRDLWAAEDIVALYSGRAERLAQLQHPHILPLLGVAELPHPVHRIVGAPLVDVVYPMMPARTLTLNPKPLIIIPPPAVARAPRGLPWMPPPQPNTRKMHPVWYGTVRVHRLEEPPSRVLGFGSRAERQPGRRPAR